MKVLVTGGTGFVGTHLVNRLLHRGHAVAVLARDSRKTRNRYNRPVETVPGDVLDPSTLVPATAGRDAVVHLVGIISERGSQTFDRMHREAAENVVAAASAAGVSRYLHMSAMGSSEDSPSEYGRTKAAGEKAVRASTLSLDHLPAVGRLRAGRRVRLAPGGPRRRKPGVRSGHRPGDDALSAGRGRGCRPRLRRRARETRDVAAKLRSRRSGDAPPRRHLPRDRGGRRKTAQASRAFSGLVRADSREGLRDARPERGSEESAADARSAAKPRARQRGRPLRHGGHVRRRVEEVPAGDSRLSLERPPRSEVRDRGGRRGRAPVRTPDSLKEAGVPG